MSYDVDLMVKDALGDEHSQYDVGNYTSNVSVMWTEALGFPLADMHGRRAGEFVAALERAVALMDGERARFEEMNPPNGWGDAQGARDYLARLLDGCKRWPDTTVEVSR